MEEMIGIDSIELFMFLINWLNIYYKFHKQSIVKYA